MYTILIADDDPVMLSMIEKLLRRDGYTVLKTSSAQGVMNTVKTEIPDLLLIDINLPDRNGLLLCRDLRQNENFQDTPIVFLTAGPASADDIAAALNAGGDDFIRKPFAARELSARIRAHLRRVQTRSNSQLPHLRLIPSSQEVYLNDQSVDLTRVEFNLLYQMCKRPNSWQTTRDLLVEVWRYPGNVGDAALVRNHIRNLRRKIEPNPDHPTVILSRHRRGYMVAARVEVLDGAAQHT